MHITTYLSTLSKGGEQARGFIPLLADVVNTFYTLSHFAALATNIDCISWFNGSTKKDRPDVPSHHKRTHYRGKS